MFRCKLRLPAVFENLEARKLLSVDFGWAIGGGCSGKAQADALTTGPDGSVYVLGRFSGTLDVDPRKSTQFLLTALGSSDLFIAKYSADRKLIWAQEAGGADGQYFPTAMSLDRNGIMTLVGSFTGTVDLAPGRIGAPTTSHGGEDGFIIEMDANRAAHIAHTWIGGPYYDAIRTVDSSTGTPVVGGVFTNTADFTGVGTVKSAGGKDGFIFAYTYDVDVNGVLTLGGKGYDAVNQLSFDVPTLTLSVVGTMEESGWFGSTVNDSKGRSHPVYLTSAGGRDAFYARYSATGALRNVFAQRYGGSGDEFGYALAANGSAAYIAGTFVEPMNGLISTGGRDLFVQKIGGGTRQIGSAANDAMGKLAIESTGRLIVTGMYGAPMKFNKTSLFNEGKSDVFLATYDNAFVPESIVGLGGPYSDTTTALATGPGGAVCLAGSFQRWIDLAPGATSARIYGNRDGEYWVDQLIIA